MPQLSRTQHLSELDLNVNGKHVGGELHLPPRPVGVILFIHGLGSNRNSPRNQFVSRLFQDRGFATLLFDLLSPDEEAEAQSNGNFNFSIDLFSQRVLGATRWIREQQAGLPIGYFGSSSGAAAALVASTISEIPISAIVSRGGRPDLAGTALGSVKAPTLLMVGSRDREVLKLNERAYLQLECPKDLVTIPGAGHLFSEPGTLEAAADHAVVWFQRYLEQLVTTA
jgi:pimeloyl-ACP methyl ester carboxylesterase